MKEIKVNEEIISCDNGKDVIYTAENGVYIRDVLINAGIGCEVLIGNISDIHINYCNAEDFKESDPVVLSTCEYRRWCAGASSVMKLRRSLEFLDDADQIVINGDTLDYLSKGVLELMDLEIWDKIPGVIATVGGHERAKQMQGKVRETSTIEDHMKELEKYWRHDIYYYSKLIKNKVLVVGLCDDRAIITKGTLEKLRADIELSRKNGYIMLLFAHEPIKTNNPAHANYTTDMVLTEGDTSGFPYDFCSGNIKGSRLLGWETCDATSKEAYELIVNSADVIKGFFGAHFHNDMHMDILAKANGEDAVIPQYITTATAYGEGHLMRILVK